MNRGRQADARRPRTAWRVALTMAVSIAATAVAAVSQERRAPIPLEEIERGMRGYGLSVFEGSSAERFEVEVIGVLRNMNPGVSFILARLSGRDLEQTGVIRGMSGSPVFLDERLAGAVSFSWDFSDGAIAGITPIEQMRALERLPAATPSRPVSELGAPAALAALAGPPPSGEVARERLERHVRALLPALGIDGATSSVQFVASGFGDLGRGWLRRALGETSVSGRTEDAPPAEQLGLGSSVAAVLVGGDLQLAASGTVTERDGDSILAFGHPVFGFGPVRIPMASAEVVTVVPSRLSSFKLTNIGPVLGAFDEDRLAGVRGAIGAEAPTAAVTVRVLPEGRQDEERSYHLQLADIPIMRPTLLAISMLQAIDAAGYTSGEQSLDLEARFEVDGHPPFDVQQTFEGSGAALGAAIYLLSTVGFLELNPYEDLETRAIEIAVRQRSGVRSVELLAASAERRQVRPGETVGVVLDLRSHRGERSQRRVEVTVPEQAAPGRLYVFVGDGSTVDSAILQIEPFDPRNLKESLQLLDSFHPRSDLGVLVARPARGMVVDGRALPDLPDSMRELLGAGSSLRTKPLGLSIDARRFTPFGRPLDGIERIDLDVLPAQETSR